MSIATTPSIPIPNPASQLTGPTEDTSKKTLHRSQVPRSPRASSVTPPLMVEQPSRGTMQDAGISGAERRVSLPSLNNLLNYSHTHSNVRGSLDDLRSREDVCRDTLNSGANSNIKTEQSGAPGSKSIPRALPNPVPNEVALVDPTYYDQRRESLEFLADTALNSSKSSSISGISPEAPKVVANGETTPPASTNENPQYLELIAQILVLKNSMFRNMIRWPIGETGSSALIDSIPKSELQQLLADSRKLTTVTRDLLLLKTKREPHSAEQQDERGMKNEVRSPAEKNSQTVLPGLSQVTKLEPKGSALPPIQRLPMPPPSSSNRAAPQWEGDFRQFRFPSVAQIEEASKMTSHVGPGPSYGTMQAGLSVQDGHKRNSSSHGRGGTYSVSLKPYLPQQPSLLEQKIPGQLQHTDGRGQLPPLAQPTFHGNRAYGEIPNRRQTVEGLRPSHALPPPPVFHRMSIAQPNPAFREQMQGVLHVSGTHRHVLSEPTLPTMVIAPDTSASAAAPKTPNRRKRQRRTASTSGGGIGGASAGVCLHCQERDTPEWRRGPYGNRTLCNACGLFYNKLIKKFGTKEANMVMHYRRRVFPDDRRVPDVVEVPETFVKLLDQRQDLDDKYAVVQPSS
ncbi:AaceriADR249Wp [[Ashbya] aceris (nom. inval.)]|nr:AaceriADR249Wp [[Ashbya] aceris (nom. inval.)]